LHFRDRQTNGQTDGQLRCTNINDLPDFCSGKHDAKCAIYLYADDAKIYKTITNGEDDQDILQRVISRLKEWCEKWLVSININKCMSFDAKHNKD